LTKFVKIEVLRQHFMNAQKSNTDVGLC